MTTINTTADAVRRIRERDALLAEALIRDGRSNEIPSMIRAGINVERIPPLAEPAPKQPAQTDAGFDREASARRFQEQTRAVPTA